MKPVGIPPASVEDVAIACGLVVAAIASRKASIRAYQRAISALRVVYKCDGCEYSEIKDKGRDMRGENFMSGKRLDTILQAMEEQFYKEEIEKWRAQKPRKIAAFANCVVTH